MKQIAIDDLMPLLKKGWVAMDKNGHWYWYSTKPRLYTGQSKWKSTCYDYIRINTFEMKDFIPFDGNWKDSLRRVK